MKLTYSQLEALIEHPEFGSIPRDVALAKGNSGSWEETIEDISCEGMKATSWKVAYLISIMFDTYGPAIREVKIANRSEKMKFGVETYINGHEMHWRNRIVLDPQDQEVCEAIDQKEAIRNFIDEAALLSGSIYDYDHLKPTHKPLIETHLAACYTSAEQAIQIAQRVAPEIHAWAKVKMLQQSFNEKHTEDLKTLKM